MPELPEVENVVRSLSLSCLGQKIKDVEVFSEKIRYPIPVNLSSLLSNVTIKNLSRKGKYILIGLDNSYTSIIHLGMSGKILINKKISKHDHFAINMVNGNSLIYNDPRYFGFVDIIKTSDLLLDKRISKLGIEPFSDLFTADNIYNISSKKSCNIKQFLLNQEFIAGIGNIYASEILFRLKLNPYTSAKEISVEKIEELILITKDVLLEAIKFGGTSIRDYQDSFGNDGSFQNMLFVYNREGLNCRLCKDSILRITQSGRSTYYCPSCQK